MTCSAIIFDLDGTLINSLPDLTNAMNFALESFHFPLHSTDNCKKMIGNGVKTFAQRAIPQDKQHLRDEILSRMRRHYYDNCFEYSWLYDGVLDTVKKLRQKAVRLAVLTNKDHNVARRIIDHFFGDSIFEHVVGIEGNETVKPDTAATMRIVKSMGLECADFLFVGDSDIDINTAAAAKIRSVGAAWGFRGKDELQNAGADIIINSPKEILDLLT